MPMMFLAVIVATYVPASMLLLVAEKVVSELLTVVIDIIMVLDMSSPAAFSTVISVAS